MHDNLTQRTRGSLIHTCTHTKTDEFLIAAFHRVLGEAKLSWLTSAAHRHKLTMRTLLSHSPLAAPVVPLTRETYAVLFIYNLPGTYDRIYDAHSRDITLNRRQMYACIAMTGPFDARTARLRVTEAPWQRLCC